MYLAEQIDIVPQKRLSRKHFLAAGHPQRLEVIAAYDKELSSIVNMGVMREIQPGTARYAEALASPATTVSRVLLGIKGDGTLTSEHNTSRIVIAW